MNVNMSKYRLILSLVFLCSSAARSGMRPCLDLLSEVQSKQALLDLVQNRTPPRYTFVKDAPILGFTITSAKFEDLPKEIVGSLGAVDQTTYTEAYLAENIGSVIALQMNGDKPDFYVIGKAVFESKYRSVALDEVAAKNPKYYSRLSPHVSPIVEGDDPHLVAILKTTPTPMTKMSDLGFPVDRRIVIESPWGEQTKPAGQDAFLAFDDSNRQYYMINVDASGLPLSYIPQK